MTKPTSRRSGRIGFGLYVPTLSEDILVFVLLSDYECLFTVTGEEMFKAANGPIFSART